MKKKKDFEVLPVVPVFSSGKGLLICFLFSLSGEGRRVLMHSRVNHGRQFTLANGEDGNGDFSFCRQCLWHQVKLLPPCFKERNRQNSQFTLGQTS